jgi:hypothetical protein
MTATIKKVSNAPHRPRPLGYFQAVSAAKELISNEAKAEHRYLSDDDIERRAAKRAIAIIRGAW